jgi:hypothetical protein
MGVMYPRPRATMAHRPRERRSFVGLAVRVVVVIVDPVVAIVERGDITPADVLEACT